jgi:hypothetical protein
MTPSREEVDRLIEALSRSWDGCAAEGDATVLEDFVRRHGEEGVRSLVEVSSLHLELQHLVASSRVYEEAMRQVRASAARAEDAIAPAELASRTRSLYRFVGANTLRRAAYATAALLLLAASVWFVQPPKEQRRPVASAPVESQLIRPSQPVGCIVSLSDAKWVGGDDLAVGINVKEGRRLELLSGQAHLSMVCGADLVLQAPCVVSLVSDDEVRLEKGKLTAQAAKWATGFVVTTDDLRVTDLGTRFAVSNDGSGVVEAHVLEGEILAEPMKQRRPRRSSMLLESGQAIRVDPLHSSIDVIAARRNDFVDEIKDFRPLRPISMWNTGLGLQIGDTDPHWRLTKGSPEAGPYPRQPVVFLGDTGSYKNNRPEVSQWVSVREELYPGVPPESVHTFETTFELKGYDLDTVYIVGQFLVDDAINSLRINGKEVPFDRWVTTWDIYDFKSFHPIEIVDGFVDGVNVISIDVYNSPSAPRDPSAHNPTGLRVEWQAFGCESL